MSLLSVSICYTSLISVQAKEQPMFVRSTYRITQVEYAYGSATLSGAYLSKLYLQNHWVALDLQYTYGCATLNVAYLCLLQLEDHCVALHLWVSNRKCTLTWFLPSTESVGETTYMGVQLKVQPILVGSMFSITVLHQSYGCATLIAAHVGYVYLPNHQVTLHIWVSNVKSTLCLLPFPSESMGYTSLTGVQL